MTKMEIEKAVSQDVFRINQFRDMTNRINNIYLKREDQLIEYILREFAEPPIKGEITKGKLKWRKIEMKVEMGFGTYSKWIEQRGQRIGPKISWESKIDL